MMCMQKKMLVNAIVFHSILKWIVDSKWKLHLTEPDKECYFF